jgi:hypothetical protein
MREEERKKGVKGRKRGKYRGKHIFQPEDGGLHHLFISQDFQ